MEEFKLFFESYEVSNIGNVRRMLLNGEYNYLKCSINNRGYKYFQILRNKERTNFLIHIAVAKLFIGERPEGLVIDHIDRNKLNNDVSNLRYITQKENSFNHDRVIHEIPQDAENRKSKVDKLYHELNKEVLLQKKKEYYYKNRDELLQKDKLKRDQNIITYLCELCNEERTIQQKTFQNKKSKICRSCSAKKNLRIPENCTT